VEPVFGANYLMLGPGSPSYAVRQLADSLVWSALLARHRLGHPIVLASAAVIAASAWALPVYEIYKVGEDLHWKPGLDLFGPFGARLVFVPHWDNREGGADLDTSHCFMGTDRFARLLDLLPPDVTVVGIDESTALVVDFAARTCHVLGHGGVTIRRGDVERRLSGRDCCEVSDLGIAQLPEPSAGIRRGVWEEAIAREQRARDDAEREPDAPPPKVVALADERAAARANRDWPAADRLRRELASLGWEVQDRPEGYQIRPLRGAS
jgi:hypothetical protein